jgi:hypothetical protein
MTALSREEGLAGTSRTTKSMSAVCAVPAWGSENGPGAPCELAEAGVTAAEPASLAIRAMLMRRQVRRNSANNAIHGSIELYLFGR